MQIGSKIKIEDGVEVTITDINSCPVLNAQWNCSIVDYEEPSGKIGRIIDVADGGKPGG